MITFRPLDALRPSPQRFYHDAEWLMILAHFAEEFGGRPFRYGVYGWEILNGTSSINNSHLDGFDAGEAGAQARARLAKLFQHAGWETEAGLFLWRLGIREAGDLGKPITIPGRPPKYCWGLPWWANQRGRLFKKSPNRYHPKARWVEKCRLGYSVRTHTWSVVFFYSYPHDSSSWSDGVTQRRGESLEKFGNRVTAWIEDKFVPESRNGPLWRPARERRWTKAHDAMEVLFGWRGDVPTDYSEQVADILQHTSSGFFAFSKARLATLKRWAREERRKNPDNEPKD